MLTKFYLKIYIAANNFNSVLFFNSHYERENYIHDVQAQYRAGGVYFSQWEISGNEQVQAQVQKMQAGLQSGYDLQIVDLQRRIEKYKSIADNKCNECLTKSQLDTLQKSYDRLRFINKDMQDKYKHILDNNNNTYSTIDTLLYTDNDSTINEYMEKLQNSLQKVGELRQVNARLVLAYILNLISNSKSNK